MIIICGATIAEVERDLEMAKLAVASGMPMGIGGATVEDAEQALAMMKQMGLPIPATISNPNYTAPDPIEEEEDCCPLCDATYPEWDGECCEVCDYGYEGEEEENEVDSLDDLSAREIDNIAAKYGLPSAWADIVRKMLGM